MKRKAGSTDRLFCFDAKELVGAVLTSVYVAERSRVARVTWYKRDTIHLVHVQHFLYIQMYMYDIALIDYPVYTMKLEGRRTGSTSAHHAHIQLAWCVLDKCLSYQTCVTLRPFT